MSASIVLAGLSWSLPDGRSLFSDLDLSFGAERTGLVGRNGVGKTTLLKLIAGDFSPAVGSIAVSGRVGVLRQAVQVAGDDTIADLFGVRDALRVLERAERGEASPDELAGADWTLGARMDAALARVGLNADAETRLAALSGGQRTRASLAALVFGEPDFLLLDEPTNNLDRDGRDAVIALLAGWRAGAIVVSHDRELLDEMDAIVELTSLGAARYGGNWSAYRERKALELAAARHDLADAEKRVAEAARVSQERLERQARRDRGGKRKAMRGDAPKILLGKMKNNAENTSGENARLAEHKRAEASADVAAARERIEVLAPLSVTLAPTGLAAGKVVVRAEGVTAGYAPDAPVLRDVSFIIAGPEQVAITGANGSGKTTLLSVLTGALAPFAGEARVFVPYAILDQRVSVLDPALSIRENFMRINPEADENACRAALARFMFRADAALQIVGTLSGGQMLRAGLACVLGSAAPPQLLILDEPTNHLDIESIETVEAGLRAYDGALVVVSHDEAFLENVNIERRIEL
ncbi:ABC-F family ATP-binding cassette domain-containing protein [Terricaulis sp.]|uniref:ABC-F family ATP-binding cassette domain-containing protein n=1 Tax=Terricaulis sp. TaxID=2768686 RepID=UPI002AC5DB85|nr:ABC-F family ATP-binding cassette domain-containing protein [Terricaulis sp.]MDZ4691927.1 ABC-F family ATP-binding cassette domain-containing protein [Terricaulis sp.]